MAFLTIATVGNGFGLFETMISPAGPSLLRRSVQLRPRLRGPRSTGEEEEADEPFD